MKTLLPSLRALGRRTRHQTAQFMEGGSNADAFPASTRYNLRWFWLDGLFAAASDNILLTYLTLYVLALGATSGQIGMLSALSSLAAALMLLTGASLVERHGQRKPLVVFYGGGLARLMLLLLALVPLVFTGPAAVYAAIGLAVSRDAFGNLSYPAWMSLTADLVPLAWRGRYFAARNTVMGLAAMAAMLLMGELITRTGAPLGYQLAFGAAFGLGMIATFSFARLKEPAPAPPVPMPYTPRSLVQSLRTRPSFMALCVSAALWNFSLNIAGPFFNVYLARELHATAATVGILSVVTSLAGLPALRLFGRLADHWGARRVQLLTGLLIPFMPMAWVFVSQPWQAVPINLASGFLWAGYNLASFNFVLALTPADQRARYSALYQFVVTIALAGGAAVGSFIVTQWGYPAIFIGSGLGRIAAILLFAWFVRELRPTDQPPG